MTAANKTAMPGSTAVYTDTSKQAPLSELAGFVTDGDTVAVGGGLSSREPMALLRELLRAGRKRLHVVGSAHGIDIDLLCGGGAVAATSESYVGFEQDFGMAPNFRRACEDGSVEVHDNCCYTLVQQLRAAIAGLPFMPIRSVRGTDMLKLHPEFKTMECPFTGQELVLAPALKPDVALIHAQYGDEQGNLRIEGPPVADILFAQASKTVIATVEKIVSTERLKALGGVSIPYFYVTALSEAPFGAHPTACYPFYAYDRAHTQIYYTAAKDGLEAFARDYLDRYVFECGSHDQYLERIGGPAVAGRLGQWSESTSAWLELYKA
jgi:glutaconate CoA-transferase subunit A